jgi:hypothetical protein
MPDVPTLAALHERLERLERDARRSKRIALVASLALVGVTAIGAGAVASSSQPLVISDASGNRMKITATGLHMIDAHGKERILVGYNTAGLPVIRLEDGNGTPVSSWTGSNHPIIVFGQEGVTGELWVGLTNTGKAYMRGYDPSGSTDIERFYLGLSTSDHPLLQMFDAGHRMVAELQASEKPFIRLSEAGTERAYFGVSTANDGLLDLDNTSGSVNATLQGGDSPFLELWNSQRQERAFLGVYSNGSAGADFKGSDGTQGWSSP